jgi:hypothetical protein
MKKGNKMTEQETDAPITWKLVRVKAKQLKTNPNNPKIKDVKGESRLKKSLQKFGMVFDGIANADYTLIDGHSRLSLNDDPNAVLRIFIPSRALTEQEYKEMNAMYDHAKAGLVDVQLIEELFTEDQLEEWDIVTKPKKEGDGEDYVPRFEVVVECKNEQEQEHIFNQLTEEGYTCRVLQL